jgi:hypothetical protein
MPIKSKRYIKPRFLADTDKVESVMDRTMGRILKRDGRRVYKDASSDLLTMYTLTIAQLDGGSARLIRMLRRLAASHVRIEAHGRRQKAKRRMQSRTAVAA